MRLYLDDDSVEALLVRLLRHAGHDVQILADVGMAGANDPVHLTHAIREGRAILTKNYGDFQELHLLVRESQGHHPGILVVRQDANPRNTMDAYDIARAIRNLEAAGVPIVDEYTNLNAWQ
jgi:predicted nuclease of predicted toxin-antitoxin system